MRFDYIKLQENRNCFLLEGERIKGHEFHYYDSNHSEINMIMEKTVTRKKYFCIIENDNWWMGYFHLYYSSNLVFAKSLVNKAERYKKRV